MDEKGSMENMDIERMSLKDLEVVLDIERDSFSSPWSMGNFRQILSDGEHAIALVAKLKGEVVGYGIALVNTDTFHIGNLAVHHSFRRRRIGELLLCSLIEKGLERGCTFATLEVRETNQGAITLYRKFGFSPMALRQGYYDDTGENAIIMITDLKRDILTSAKYQMIHNEE